MWFVVDICGIVCIIIAYALLGCSNIAVFAFGNWPWGNIGSYLCPFAYSTLFVMSIWSHLACMLTDPGAIPLASNSSQAASTSADGAEEGTRWCNKCKSNKPLKAHHCSVCRRCILKMDHHCPWVNNCVGARNQKHFVLFLFYVQLQCWFAAGILGSRFLELAAEQNPRQRPQVFLPSSQTVLPGLHSSNEGGAMSTSNPTMLIAAEPSKVILGCVGILFVALLFGLFTAMMLCDQLSNIHSNQSSIDALQGREAKARPFKESLQEVMGRGPSLKWLLPTPVRRLQLKGDS
eukprot:TRINITY_DN2916_c0_g3_i1.p1 TRINITY_DN2916_c0_g3~~TRINITY_DN2916_c0_g3_i1.p1  ORF type:complete len:291 (-),score=24.11 TRINITY_DN2916_c0_g3_i1:180-1052(-)